MSKTPGFGYKNVAAAICGYNNLGARFKLAGMFIDSGMKTGRKFLGKNFGAAVYLAGILT